jgi:hypothetical protein
VNELKELVDEATAVRLVMGLAVALACGGVIAGAVAGAVRRTMRSSLLRGVLVGLLGPLVLALWWGYNAVIGVFGLDSVKGLLINMGLFVAVGAVVGLAGKRLWAKLGAA